MDCLTKFFLNLCDVIYGRPCPVFRMSNYTESYIHDKLKKELEADHVEVKVKWRSDTIKTGFCNNIMSIKCFTFYMKSFIFRTSIISVVLNVGSLGAHYFKWKKFCGPPSSFKDYFLARFTFKSTHLCYPNAAF